MKLHDIDDIGLDGDMLEAQAFAYLAARVARGLATSFPATTATKAPLCGGKISLP
jgi:anhydro-N-acetylmuramic acid kinase